MSSTDAPGPPSEATQAVFVVSEEMPKDAQQVEELDFNKIKGPITAEDLLNGVKHMGFQASSMCEAVRIINEMVRSTGLHAPGFPAELTSFEAGVERLGNR